MRPRPMKNVTAGQSDTGMTVGEAFLDALAAYCAANAPDFLAPISGEGADRPVPRESKAVLVARRRLGQLSH